MPKFFKLFRRKSKKDNNNSDPAAAGILSPQQGPSANPPQQQKQKKEKKQSKRKLKKQKKKDKLAHFPSTSNGNGNGGAGSSGRDGNSGGVAGGAAAATAGAVPAVPGWEEQKENSPAPPSSSSSSSSLRPIVTSGGPPVIVPASSSANYHDASGRRATSPNVAPDPPSSSSGASFGAFPGGDDPPTSSYADYYDDDIYDKPALSIIDEEKSPKSRQGSVGGGGGFPGSPISTGVISPRDRADAANDGEHAEASAGGDPSPRAAGKPLVSPMSGNKPPLTPNRLSGHRGAGGGGSNEVGGSANMTPSQYRSPNLTDRRSPKNKAMTVDTNATGTGDGRHSTTSQDESLRGTHIHGSDEMMCLSADDDDEDYNRLAAKGGNDGDRDGDGANPGNSAALGSNGKEKFVSALDRSPFGYAAEEDGNALFPALVEDKDPWQGHGQNGRGDARPHGTDGGGPAGAKSANGGGGGGPGSKNLRIQPMAHETQEDIRAWTPSPTKKNTFTFQGETNGAAKGSAGGRQKRVFENFADFEPFEPPSSGVSSSRDNNNNNKQFHGSKRGGAHGSSKSVAQGSSPVSSLIEESRARRQRKAGHQSIEGGGGPVHPLPQTIGGGGGGGGGSVNSAPVLTPSHIRGHAYPHRTSSRGGGGSISKVIDNLELHVNKRNGSSGTGGPASSIGSSSAAAAVRDAKERIRRDNMMLDESKLIDTLAAGGPGAQSAADRANAANNGGGEGNSDKWLFDSVAETIGPRAANADHESIDGRSHRSGKSRNSLGGKSHRSTKSHRSHRSKKSSRGGHRRHTSSRHDDDVSTNSRTSRNSRNSYRSYQTTKSMVSQMSEQSRSVANDLLRLEAQLSMVGKSRGGVPGAVDRPGASSGAPSGPPTNVGGSGASVASGASRHKRRDDCGMTVTSRDYSVSRSSAGGLPRRRHHHHGSSSSVGGRSHISASARRAAARTLRSKATVVAPPGKLGIILANRTDSRGTVVSGVRTSSVLAEQVSPGDRIIAIDEEDVSQMNVKEITAIMARKSEFERVLVLLAAPKVNYD